MASRRDYELRYRSRLHQIETLCIEVEESGIQNVLERLREAIGMTGLIGELLKFNEERKLMHEMLTEAGVPDLAPGDGQAMCLIGRLNLALARRR